MMLYIENLQKVIYSELQLRPNAQIEDIYKLVYQSLCGPAHLYISPKEAKDDILKELKKCDATQSTSLIEDISIERGTIRINLSQLKAKNDLIEVLTAAFMETLLKTKSDKEKFVEYWKYFANHHQLLNPKFSKETVDNFNKRVEKENFPVIHHSQTYLKEYNPHYRVVLKKMWEKTLAKNGIML